MNAKARRGLLIIAGVYLYILVAYSIFQLTTLVSAWDSPQPNWSDIAPRMLFTTLMVAICLFICARHIANGNEAIRWLGAAAMAGFGLIMIGLSMWLTTLEYHNATPEARAEMRAEDIRELPWRIGQGAFHIVVASTLTWPAVGEYLQYRRAKLAPGSVATS